jgi:hypothetical protein
MGTKQKMPVLVMNSERSVMVLSGSWKPGSIDWRYNLKTKGSNQSITGIFATRFSHVNGRSTRKSGELRLPVNTSQLIRISIVLLTMTSKPVVAPLASSIDVFRPDIFKGKVLFCTGGGSGICKSMTEAIVRRTPRYVCE